jgi:molybdopterin-guanine dinucleotide biosynthesis protein B
VKRGFQTSRPTVIGVVGGKKSGKTATIEVLTKHLAMRGYRVAVAKHFPDPSFTIDTEGKDTWRYAQSGAMVIVAASASEIATIEKTHGELSLKDVLERCRDSDIVFLEGFRKLVAKDKDMHKIVVAKSAQDVEEALKAFRPILAFAGSYTTAKRARAIPYIDARTHGREMADLVERLVRQKDM